MQNLQVDIYAKQKFKKRIAMNAYIWSYINWPLVPGVTPISGRIVGVPPLLHSHLHPHMESSSCFLSENVSWILETFLFVEDTNAQMHFGLPFLLKWCSLRVATSKK